jgi:hypothetical protein
LEFLYFSLHHQFSLLLACHLYAYQNDTRISSPFLKKNREIFPIFIANSQEVGKIPHMSPKAADFHEKQLEKAIRTVQRALNKSPSPELSQILLDMVRESKATSDAPRITQIQALRGDIKSISDRLQTLENLMQAKAHMRVLRTGALGANLGG